MIHWMDSFMAIFGLKRPEVWEADRKEHDVTFPAPHAEVHDINFVASRKRYVRSKRANVRSKRAGKRSQSAEGKNEK